MVQRNQNATWLSPISEQQRDSEDTLTAHSESEDTLVEFPNMTSNSEAEIERRRSFGIGGAGNIRSLSVRRKRYGWI